MTKIIGNHTLLFGGYLAFAQKNQENSPYSRAAVICENDPISTGNAFADLLLGQVANYTQTSAQPYLL